MTADVKRFFAKTTHDCLRDMGFGDCIQQDGTVVMYHGTSTANADAIQSSGTFLGFPFFSPDRAIAERFSRQAGKRPVVMEVRLSPDAILPTCGYFSARLEGLARQLDGTWAYPEPEVDLNADTVEIEGVRRSTRNHLGQPIAGSVAELQAFWAWFGDSALVDDQGRPLVAFHGSPERLSAFDASERNELDCKRLGAYFTSNPRLASCYGKHVHAVYLALPRVFDIVGLCAADAIDALPVEDRLKRELRSAFRGGDYSQYGLLESALRGGLRQTLQEQGYAGIRYTEGGDAYIAFEAEQIRLLPEAPAKAAKAEHEGPSP